MAGKPDGRGTISWSNGGKYVGQIKDGKRNGQGTFSRPDRSKYVGQWKDDKPDGRGFATFIIKNDNPQLPKKIYTGETINGIPEGQGTGCIYDKLGNLRSKYVGSFKKSRMFGNGSEYTYDENGKLIDTKTGWFDGKFIRSSVNINNINDLLHENRTK